MLRTDGLVLRDSLGRQRVFHGINLISKGKTGAVAGDASFRGSWTDADLDFLVDELGISLVRLGVIWAAAAPAPHQWDEDYLSWIGEQLDRLHRRGVSVVLDGHQDLYSQLFSDGAPAWATLTAHDFVAEELWSDGYLNSPAVHEALDAFWANREVAGVGLQDHLVELWVELTRRFGEHPAVIGIDILNEPTPGASAPELAGLMLGTLAQLTGQDLDQVLADYGDPEAKFAQLARLDDAELHRQIGDLVAPAMAEFETVVQAFYDRAWAALRSSGFSGLLLREHCYFGNTGVPALVPFAGPQVTYSPHGYDLVVDTEAVPLASNTRVETIFSRIRTTQVRNQVPVIVGEWGALGRMAGVSAHGEFILDLFDQYGWSHTYWCWEPGFEHTEAAQLLRRAHPVAVDGTLLSSGRRGEQFEAVWDGQGSAESTFWLADSSAKVEVVGPEGAVPFVRDGRRLQVAPTAGRVQLRADW